MSSISTPSLPPASRHSLIPVTRRYLDDYLVHDSVLRLLQEEEQRFTTHRWLLESPAKRAIFWGLYADLIDASGVRVLDIGGGLSSISKLLSLAHHYDLVDIFAHDRQSVVQYIEREAGRRFCHGVDWNDFGVGERYQVCIANDLFPNVDQRLGAFLDKFSPCCDEIRLALTFYETGQWYKARRIDGEEIFHMQAWNSKMLDMALAPYFPADALDDAFRQADDSLFPNRRQVLLARLRFSA